MLRHGKMLVEGNPQILIDQFNCSSLENLFATLSLLQNERDPTLSNRQQQMELILKWKETKVSKKYLHVLDKIIFLIKHRELIKY